MTSAPAIAARSGYKFTPKFEVPGKYKFICTYHKTVMKSTVTVKKK